MPATLDLTSCAMVSALAKTLPTIGSMAVNIGVETGSICPATSGLSGCELDAGATASGAGAGATEKLS